MKISVCMATYNGEKYVVEQIKSILTQLKENDELIISDDMSTDDTIKKIEKISDKRISIYVNCGEHGYTKNFENALKFATGDFIFLSDQDDIWVKNKVKVTLEAMKNEKIKLSISDAEIVDSNLKTIYNSHFKLRGVKKGFVINLLKTRYIGACMCMKKEFLNKALPFPRNQKLCAHDYWLAILGEASNSTILINTPLIKYRRHGENASSGGESSGNTLLHKIKVRLYVLVKITKRKCR